MCWSCAKHQILTCVAIGNSTQGDVELLWRNTLCDIDTGVNYTVRFRIVWRICMRIHVCKLMQGRRAHVLIPPRHIHKHENHSNTKINKRRKTNTHTCHDPAHYPLLARVRAYCAAKTASRPMTVITNVKYSDDKNGVRASSKEKYFSKNANMHTTCTDLVRAWTYE